jgi:hypothetical protein
VTTLRIAAAERRIVSGNSALAGDPALRGYVADLTGPYGLAVRDDVLEAGAGHSYGELVEPLITALAGEPVGLLVLAYGIHDVRLGRATATYLSSRCPGEPLAFAVCDQGTAAVFTALCMIEAYAVTGDHQRALLLVAEQPALQYEPAGPAPIPDRNAAVGLLLESGPGPHGIRVSQHPSLDFDDAVEIVAKESAGHTVITGRNLHPAVESLVDGVRPAPDGQPYTGVWWELAGALAEGKPVLVAEYDPELRYLCVAAVSAP